MLKHFYGMRGGHIKGYDRFGVNTFMALITFCICKSFYLLRGRDTGFRLH